MRWAFLFLAFVSFLAIDIITGFGLVFPRITPSLRGWALIVSGILSVIALIQGARPPVVQNYEVRLSGLPNKMDDTEQYVGAAAWRHGQDRKDAPHSLAPPAASRPG